MQKLLPDQLTAWAARAMPGETAVYCRDALSPAPDIARHALSLREAGLITLTRKREGKGFAFIAERLRVVPDQARQPRRINRGQFVRKGVSRRGASENAIFRALARAANRGMACPTNAELAKLAGLSGAVAASYRMRRLVAAGKIRVEEPSALERRVVTIVATGRATVRAML